MTSCPSDFFLDLSLKINVLSRKHLLRYTNVYIPDTIFVIQGWKEIPLEFLKTVHPDLVSKSEELTAKTRFVDGGREQFVQISNKGREVHLLKYIGEHDWLIWLESSVGANVAVLREHALICSINSLQDFELQYNRPVTIIFGGYGIGKTTCLKRIAQDLTAQKEQQFILYLDDIKLRQFYNSSSSANVVNFIKFFAIDLTNPDVHIMYDNFERLKERDVIIDIMTDIHLNYRHVKQWITSSELDCRYKLESKFGSLACVMSPVSKKCQIKYLKHIWKIDHEKFDDFINSLLKSCNKWICKYVFKLDNFNYLLEFADYPLHLRMIASTFTPNQLTHQNGNNANLEVYEAFVKSTYSNENIEEAAVVKLFEYLNHEFKFKRKVNIKPETFDFVNVTNYLAAKWFSKNFREYKAELILLMDWRCSTQSFHYFFNRLLCQRIELHTEMLSPSRDLRKVQSEITKRDDGGRTALHLAQCERFVTALVVNGAALEVEDDVLQWTPIQYYDYNTNLLCLERLLEHGAKSDKLTWTLRLSEESVTERLEHALSASLLNYAKFICQNVKELNVTPKMIGKLFSKDSTTLDFKMMVLNRAKKSSYFYIDSYGQTALFHAVQRNYLDAVKILIETLGFNINHRCCRNMTVFHTACEKGYTDIAKYLLKQGADVHATHDNNENAFTDCCKMDNLEVMQLLIENGVDTNVNVGETPLEVACEHGRYNTAKYLFENAESFNYNIDYDKLLYLSVKSASSELVEFLLSTNRITDIKRMIHGKSLLHTACGLACDTRIVHLLIQAGADVNATDGKGCTPVFEVLAGYDIVEAVEPLAEHGCNLSHFNNDGLTPLHVLVKNPVITPNYFDEYHTLVNLIQRLVTHGADVNARTPSGDTPLHFACRNGSIDVVRALVLQGSNIHAVNNSGETPLHLACSTEDTPRDADVKIFLVSKGADVNARTRSGRTPLWYALSYPANINGLVKLGADLRCTDNNLRTLVHYCVEHNLLDQLRILNIEGMNDAKSVDVFGQTALHIAAENDNLPCFELLHTYFETDVNIIDNNGLSAKDLVRAYQSKK